MKLVLMRHGIAQDEPTGEFAGKGDEFRALTDEGIQKASLVIQAISKALPDLSLVVTSPFLRTRQTGQIFSDFYSNLLFETCDELKSEAFPSQTITTINNLVGDHQTVALVGHQPHISSFASLLVCGNSDSYSFSFGRATAAVINFHGWLKPGSGQVKLMLRPNALC